MLGERTHSLTVPGVGDFVFRKRTLALQLQVEAAAERLTKGPVLSESLNRFAMAVATLEALTVSAPESWDLAEVDPLDDDAFADVLKTFGVLRAAEETFRAGAKAKRAPVGAGA